MESKGLKHLRLRGGLREKRLFFSRQKTYPRNGIRLQNLQIRRIKIKQATSFGMRFFGSLVKLSVLLFGNASVDPNARIRRLLINPNLQNNDEWKSEISKGD